MAMKRKMLWLDEEIDAAAIQIIKDRYGCESESQAMRLALRVLAGSPMLEIKLPARPTHARRSPKANPLEETVERSAYQVLESMQPTILPVVAELLAADQTPEQIGERVAAQGDTLLAGLAEMAARYMRNNN